MRNYQPSNLYRVYGIAKSWSGLPKTWSYIVQHVPRLWGPKPIMYTTWHAIYERRQFMNRSQGYDLWELRPYAFNLCRHRLGLYDVSMIRNYSV